MVEINRVKSSLSRVLGGLPIILSACAHAQLPPPPPDIGFQAEFPAVWVEQLSFAYKDFRGTVKDPVCFTLRTYREGDSYFVDFVPPSGVKIDGDRIDIPIGGANACGRGIRYEFDEAGRFVRRIGQR